MIVPSAPRTWPTSCATAASTSVAGAPRATSVATRRRAACSSASRRSSSRLSAFAVARVSDCTAARGQGGDRADRGGDEEERDQGHPILGVGDGEVVRRDDVVGQQRRGRDRGGQRRNQPTDQRHDHDGEQVEQHRAGQVHDVAKLGHTQGQQGKDDQPGQRPGEPTPQGKPRPPAQAAVVGSRRAPWMTVYARRGRPSRPAGGGSAGARSCQRPGRLRRPATGTRRVACSARARRKCVADHSHGRTRPRRAVPQASARGTGTSDRRPMRPGPPAARAPPVSMPVGRCSSASEEQRLSGRPCRSRVRCPGGRRGRAARSSRRPGRG